MNKFVSAILLLGVCQALNIQISVSATLTTLTNLDTEAGIHYDASYPYIDEPESRDGWAPMPTPEPVGELLIEVTKDIIEEDPDLIEGTEDIVEEIQP
jgi:hypothetical protein